MSLDDVEWDKNTSESCGDQAKDKVDSTMQVMLMNVGGLPTSNHHSKNHEIWDLVQEEDVDILGLAEVNMNSMEVPYHPRLQQHTIP